MLNRQRKVTNMGQTEKEIERKFPNSQAAYYSVDLCFKKRSLRALVHYRASGKEWEEDEMDELDLPTSVGRSLAKEIVHFFDRKCDEHNELRAIQYARAYIQEKALYERWEGLVRDYSFEHFSDAYDKFFRLEQFCSWNFVVHKKPTLFGQVAEGI
jgi:hypothetical protein